MNSEPANSAHNNSAAGDVEMSAFLRRTLPPENLETASDAELEHQLAQVQPLPIDVDQLLSHADSNGSIPLSSGREAGSDSKSPVRWLAASAYVVVAAIAIPFLPDWKMDKERSALLEEEQFGEWQVDFPPPVFVGTPALSASTGASVRLQTEPKRSLRVPDDARENIALGRAVSSSASPPLEGELQFITDGERQADAVVAIDGGLQWVQVDLASTHEIFGIVVWHDYSTESVYSDVIVAISDDPEFASTSTVVFNNDADGSAGSPIEGGNDLPYRETNFGQVIEIEGIKGRYIRLYSNGSSRDVINQYVEVEAFGRPVQSSDTK